MQKNNVSSEERTEFIGQFIISDREIHEEDFEFLPINNGLVLSYHRNLPVHYDEEQDLLILGYVWSTVAGDNPFSLRVDHTLTGDEFKAAEQNWCGRYVTVHRGVVMQDLDGMMPVFYDPEIGASSDPYLLAKQNGMQEKLYSPGVKMGWMPAPLTQYEGVKRLLLSQTYDCRTGLVSYVPTVPDTYRWTFPEDAYKEFKKRFLTGLQNMHAAYPERELLVALTGGVDSRTLFAAMVKAELPFESYTLERSEMSEDDYTYPGIVAKKAGIPYTWIDRNGAPDEEKLDEYDHHVCGLVADEDRLLFAYGQYRELLQARGPVFLLRSAVWGSCTNGFEAYATDKDVNPDFYDQFEIKEGSLEYKSLEEYFDWCRHHMEDHPLYSRIYGEQRDGAWMSYIERGFDLFFRDAPYEENGKVENRVVPIQPVNCRAMLALMYQFRKEDLDTKEHQKSMTLEFLPVLAGVPYDTKAIRGDTRWKMILRKGGAFARSVKRIGVRRTAGVYLKKIEKKRKAK